MEEKVDKRFPLNEDPENRVLIQALLKCGDLEKVVQLSCEKGEIELHRAEEKSGVTLNQIVQLINSGVEIKF